MKKILEIIVSREIDFIKLGEYSDLSSITVGLNYTWSILRIILEVFNKIEPQ